jgi:hypothetical protein
MRIAYLPFLAALLIVIPAGSQQAPAPVAPAAAPVPPAPPSATLRPALDMVKDTLFRTDVSRWKRGGIRDEADGNINDILNDIQKNVPPLMETADAAPASLSGSLPLLRHINALYDVLLRIVQGARVVAPGEQVDRLQSALVTLGNARIALQVQLQQVAVAQEKQLTDLRQSLQKQTQELDAIKSAPPPPCKPVEPPKRRTTRRRHTTRKTTEKAKTPPASTTQKPKQ